MKTLANDDANMNGKDPLAQRIQRLRALVEEGLESGQDRADTPDDWAELRAIARGEIE